MMYLVFLIIKVYVVLIIMWMFFGFRLLRNFFFKLIFLKFINIFLKILNLFLGIILNGN